MQVTAAVIIEDGRILLARRPPGDPLAGLWELPGGKIEPGETPQECLERELLEEFGMRSAAGAVVARTAYRYEHGAFELVALEAERLSGYVLRVHDEVRWVGRGEITQLSLAPADVALVEAVLATGMF